MYKGPSITVRPRFNFVNLCMIHLFDFEACSVPAQDDSKMIEKSARVRARCVIRWRGRVVPRKQMDERAADSVPHVRSSQE